MFRTASPDRYNMLKAYARENRKNASLAEDVLWQNVRNGALGYRFLRQHIVGDYIADFICLDGHLIVEVDGGYHSKRHQHEDDNVRTSHLNQMGFYVTRFTNEQVLFDTEYVLARIKELLNQIKNEQ